MGKNSRGFKITGSILIKFLIGIVIFFLVVYTISSVVLLLGIQATDPLEENSSTHKILSQTDTDQQSSLFIFETGSGNDRRISDVYVLVNNTKKEHSLLIYIPGYLYYTGLEENFGSPIAISSLRYAGDFLQEGRGMEYAIWQIQEVVGFKVDEYVWITPEAHSLYGDVYGDIGTVKEREKEAYTVSGANTLSESFFKLHSFSSRYSYLRTLLGSNVLKDIDIRSNLKFSRVISRIKGFEKLVSETKTYAIDLGTSSYTKNELSDLGGQVKNISLPNFDTEYRGYMIDLMDKELEKERVRVEVYNASEVAGRAGVYARKLINSGLDVVRFGNAPNSTQNTQVYISDDSKFDHSLDVVSEVLGGRYEEISERPSFMTTGDIVILLGEDISNIEIF